MTSVRRRKPQVAPGKAEQTQSFLVIHTGGLGDVVLAAPLLSALKLRFPESQTILLTKAAFCEIALLFPHPPDEIIPLPLNPFQELVPTALLYDKLRELVQLLKGFHFTTVVAADLEPTWLGWFLGSALAPATAVACARISPPRGLLPILVSEMGFVNAGFQGPQYQEGIHETERYRKLAAFLDCTNEPNISWTRPKVPTALFKKFAVSPQNYTVCFPFGSPDIAVKRWGTAQFAEVLREELDSGKKLVLAGDDSQREALVSFRKSVPHRPRQIQIFTGKPKDLPSLAALIAYAGDYLGIDTGTAHIAQAYQVPGVVIFGGGHWPHYAPWGAGTIGVVRRLGCFNCGWDCAFGKAHCLESLPAGAVHKAFRKARKNPSAPPQIVEVPAPQNPSPQLLSNAITAYLAAQSDRLKRFQESVELEWRIKNQAAELSKLSGVTGQVRQEADRRLEGLVELTGVIAERDARIHDLETSVASHAGQPLPDQQANEALQEKNLVIELMNRSLAVAADKRILEMEQVAAQHSGDVQLLNAALEDSSRRLAEFQQAAQQRLQQLDWTAKKVSEIEAEADRRSQDVETLSRMVEDRDAQVELFRGASEERLQRLNEISAKIGLIEIEASRRSADVQLLTAMIAEKDAVIAELSQASTERLERVEALQLHLQQAEQQAESRSADVSKISQLLAGSEAQTALIAKAAGERLAMIELLNKQLAASQRDREALRELAERRQSNFEKAEYRIGENKQTIRALQGQLTDREAETAEFKGAAAQRLSMVELLNQQLTAEQSDREQLRRLSEERQSNFEAATFRVGEIEETVTVLRNELLKIVGQSDGFEAAAAQRLSMIEQLNQNLATAQSEREQLRQLAEKHQTHFEAAQYRIGEIEQTVGALQGRLKDSEVQSEGFATAAAQRLSMIEQLNQQLANAQGEREQLRQLAEERQAQFEAAQYRIGEIEQTVADLHARLKDSEAQSEGFATAAALRLSMIEQLNQQLANAQSEREQLRLLAEKHQSHFEGSQYRIGEIEQTVADLQGRLKDSEAQSEGLATAAAQRLSMIEQLNQQLANTQGEREQLRQLAEERQSQFESAQYRIGEIEQTVVDLHARLKDSEAQSAGFATAAALRLSMIEQLNQQLANAQGEREHLRQLAEARQVQFEALQERLKDSEAQSREFATAAAQRLSKIDLLSQQIDSTQNVLSQESATRAMFEQAAAERLVAIEILNSSLSEEQAKGELLGKELAAERVRGCDLEEKLARIEELYSSIRQSEVVLLKEVVALREENLIPSIVRRFK